MVRLPGICNGDPETTVLAHLNGGGMGMEHHDLMGAWCCSSCHDALDGRGRCQYSPYTLVEWHKDAVLRTIQALIDEDVICTR